MMSAGAYPIHPCSSTPVLLAQVCQLLDIDAVTAQLLHVPQRELSVAFSYECDDGALQMVTGCHICHNNACGPTLGAVRWGTQYSPEWIRALAAWMTWSTALFELPFGGAAGAIFAPVEGRSLREQERIARGYIRAVGASNRTPTDLILTSGDTRPASGWMLDELSVLTSSPATEKILGKPLSLGGLPRHHEVQARVAIIAMQNAAQHLAIDLRGAPMAIQGFDDLGMHLAQLAIEMLDARIVAISDGSVAVHHPAAINWKTAWAHCQQTGSLAGVPETEPISPDALRELPVTMLCLTKQPAIITADDAPRIQARIIAEMTCGAMTLDADTLLYQQQCAVLPDLLCMAGEVLLAYFEWTQSHTGLAWDATTIDASLVDRVSRAFTAIAHESEKRQVTPRQAAYLLAVQRVLDAGVSRGRTTK